ncbi:MAG: GNAT family N-acetyltransferase [Spirochaetes bacterium]|nr:GNAT family N-acetyltransferase [Spirochaetota bacterium]
MNTNISVRMDIDSLDPVSDMTAPEGFRFRMYTPGDIDDWVELYRSADIHNKITPELFRNEFGSDETVIAQRMLFLVDATDGRMAGTSTAWHDTGADASLGRVHWVAIRPELQGQGLAKPLLAQTLMTLKMLGHTRAYLITSTARIPAITLYLKFGFYPVARTDEEMNAWRTIIPEIKPEFRNMIIQGLGRDEADKK